MERKEFIKRLGLTTLVVPIVAVHNNSQDARIDVGNCVGSPRETAGPFPTKNPNNLMTSDIRSDRTGIGMTVEITVQNKNDQCRALAGALVDIWHCDKDGYYSEYGGSGMQPVDLQSEHFLRGRQKTDADGKATFTSIFPGWYRGRAPHIHVQIFSETGKSLLVTQIAFPTEVCDTVYTKVTQHYTRGKQDTPNESDGVFANSLENQMGIVTGSIAKGFELRDTIVVTA